MSERLIDFDAARRERDADPILIRVGGEVLKLTAAMPAAVQLDIERLHRKHGEGEVNLPVDDLLETCRLVFGEENLDKILNVHRLSFDEIGELLNRTLAMYFDIVKDDDPPNRAARRRVRRRSTSSPTGRSSKPTSSASTSSTSPTAGS